MKIKTLFLSALLAFSLNAFSQTLFVPSGTSGIGVSSTTNIGIGISNPSYKFHVNSSVNGWASVIQNQGCYVYSAYGNGATDGYGMQIRVNNKRSDRYALRVFDGTNNLLYVRNDGKIGIGTASPISKLHLVNSVAGGIRVDAPEAMIIQRAGWTGICKFGISGEFGWSRGLRFTVAPNETSTQIDALYLESTGNVSMGISDPAGASLKVYRSQLPTFELANSISRLQVGIAYSGGQFAHDSKPGDVVFRPMGGDGHHGMVFYLPNDKKDGNSYIKFGDDGNNLWMGIFNNRTVRINGTVIATKMMVKADVWSDYVFDPGYKLKSLNEIESYIKDNKHLPDVPSANEVIEQGIDIAQMNAVLLRKVEELTLLMIEQNKTIQSLQIKVSELQK